MRTPTSFSATRLDGVTAPDSAVLVSEDETESAPPTETSPAPTKGDAVEDAPAETVSADSSRASVPSSEELPHPVFFAPAERPKHKHPPATLSAAQPVKKAKQEPEPVAEKPAPPEAKAVEQPEPTVQEEPAAAEPAAPVTDGKSPQDLPVAPPLAAEEEQTNKGFFKSLKGFFSGGG